MDTDAGDSGSTAVRDSPGRRLRRAIEPIATLGYHATSALDLYEERFGFDFIHAYTWMRASSAGAPDSDVVVAAFGVWDAATISTTYVEARERASLDEIRDLRLEAVTAALHEVITEDARHGLEDTTVALERAVAACSTLGKPLFAGLVGHPRPADPLGRLWHATNCLREHRGDAHLAAIVGTGVDGVQANLLNERRHGFELFSFTSTRYHSQDRMDTALAGLRERGLVSRDDTAELTESGSRLLVDVEDRTDAADQVVLDSLGPDLDTHVSRLDGWSQLILDRGWYPDEPGKRDAG